MPRSTTNEQHHPLCEEGIPAGDQTMPCSCPDGWPQDATDTTPAALRDALFSIGHLMADAIREHGKEGERLADEWQRGCAALFDADVLAALPAPAPQQMSKAEITRRAQAWADTHDREDDNWYYVDTLEDFAQSLQLPALPLASPAPTHAALVTLAERLEHDAACSKVSADNANYQTRTRLTIADAELIIVALRALAAPPAPAPQDKPCPTFSESEHDERECKHCGWTDAAHLDAEFGAPASRPAPAHEALVTRLQVKYAANPPQSEYGREMLADLLAVLALLRPSPAPPPAPTETA